MNSKSTKNLTDLASKAKEIIKPDGCKNVKGGGYWCCIRNKYIYW